MSDSETHQFHSPAYGRNLRRIYALIVFPQVVITNVRATDKISNEVIAKHKEEISLGKMSEQELSVLIEKAHEGYAEKRHRILYAQDAATTALLENEERLGFGILDDLLSDKLVEGADAWLSAQITGVWTAIEALAEELWVAALNTHPVKLAELKRAKAATGEKDHGKSIPLVLLQKHRFDLSKSMGFILKEKYNFDKLEGNKGIRSAYFDAFSEDGDDIQNVLSDKSLEALALVRNLIVHKGGIIDEDYLKRKASLPAAAIGPLHSELQFDGELVAMLIEKPIQLSFKLIIAVKDWLERHA